MLVVVLTICKRAIIPIVLLCVTYASSLVAGQVLKSVQLVWISHMHPDHHLGLPRLLLERATVCVRDKPVASPALLHGREAAVVHSYCVSVQSDTVVVIGPGFMGEWLADLCTLFPALATAYRFVDATLFWLTGSVSGEVDLAADPADIRLATAVADSSSTIPSTDAPADESVR